MIRSTSSITMNFTLWLSVFLAATVDAGTYETIQGRSCFRSMKGMMDSMLDLAADSPNLMTITDIGDSYLKNHDGRHDGVHDIPDGGYDIYALNITASDSGRQSNEKGKMLVTSGVHAREWAPPELLARFIEMLVHGYDDNADITWILQHTEIHAILYVNPDGRFMAEKYPELYWRKNLNPIRCGGGYEYGVDINRNFDWAWGDQTGASSNPCAGDYHGPTAESEPETQAFADYAKKLFPDEQRKSNPQEQMNDSFGESNTGMYIDIHSSGGYIYYPWGHKDAKSPDDEALQALGRKINSFNNYKLWAGSQPDFLYEASGDTSDWAYGVLGVASLGFEIGDDFQQECDSFEEEVVPQNLPALLFAAKTAQKPFSTIKGPDVLEMSVRHVNGEIRVSAHASDSKMVNAITGSDAINNFPDFPTGDQSIKKVQLYIDVHPDDYTEGDVSWEMQSVDNALDSEEETVGIVLPANTFSPGRHMLFAQATDSDDYKGPVTSMFVEVSTRETSRHAASLRGSRAPSP
mmetsp:Transcript_23105/g.37657  ORF Transcript_23105/g.37657 Transcript_23105/m.37657 type:complete len:521 (+) Transcript_23105:147-1709(+)